MKKSVSMLAALAFLVGANSFGHGGPGGKGAAVRPGAAKKAPGTKEAEKEEKRVGTEAAAEKRLRDENVAARAVVESGGTKAEEAAGKKGTVAKMAQAVTLATALLASDLQAAIKGRADLMGNPSTRVVAEQVMDKLAQPGSLRALVNIPYAHECLKPVGTSEEALSTEAATNLMTFLNSVSGANKQEMADSALTVFQDMFATTDETRQIAEESGRNLTSREIDMLEACRRLKGIAAASKADGCPLITAIPSECAPLCANGLCS